MNIECAGETLVLCTERALYWPAQRALLIADTHFGKDEIFRRAGLPVPQGVSTRDLSRISVLVTQHSAQRLIVLGDFFHGAPAHSKDFQNQFSAWLETHPQLRIDIVAGNHDRHGADGLWNDRLHWQREPYIEEPFALSHRQVYADSSYTLSGHIHPVLRLRSANRDRARLPVFWFGERLAVLPAFGSFTGGAEIEPHPNDRLFAITDSTIVALMPGSSAPSTHPRS